MTPSAVFNCATSTRSQKRVGTEDLVFFMNEFFVVHKSTNSYAMDQMNIMTDSVLSGKIVAVKQNTAMFVVLWFVYLFIFYTFNCRWESFIRPRIELWGDRQPKKFTIFIPLLMEVSSTRFWKVFVILFGNDAFAKRDIKEFLGFLDVLKNVKMIKFKGRKNDCKDSGIKSTKDLFNFLFCDSRKGHTSYIKYE